MIIWIEVISGDQGQHFEMTNVLAFAISISTTSDLTALSISHYTRSATMPRCSILLLHGFRPPAFPHLTLPLRRPSSSSSTAKPLHPPPPSLPRSRFTPFLRPLLPLLTAYATITLLTSHFLSLNRVTGPSMAPFLNDTSSEASRGLFSGVFGSDWVWVDKTLPWRIALLFDHETMPQRGWGGLSARFQRWVCRVLGLDRQEGRGVWRRGWVIAFW